MTGLAYAVALLLSGVLSKAGMAKLRRPLTTAASFESLGLPLAHPLARAVPVLELSVAAALVTRPSVGGPLAIVLLMAFTVALGRAVARGVACACFGGAAEGPASTVEVVRNVGLLGLGALASTAHPVVPALADVIAVTTAAVVGLVGLALLDLRRTIGRVWGNSLAGEMTAEVTP